MGIKGKAISTVDNKQLVTLLRKAIADEWLAIYHYWYCAQVAVGITRPAVTAEFLAHAAEERGHADKLANRIYELGGTPPTSPAEIIKLSPNGYLTPTSTSIKELLEKAVEMERMAITDYNTLANLTLNKDHISYQLITSILADEVNHEEDLEMFLEDLR